jgi:AGZA family xanthine/uracil permease-like MFS transporter
VALDRYGVRGGIMIGVLAVTIASIVLGYSKFEGIVAPVPDPSPVLLQLDIAGALNVGLISIIFAFLFVDMFDNSGTLIGIAHRAGLLDKDGKVPRLGRALIVDSSAAMAGAALGTSTTTSSIESASGIKVGGRTGLTAVVVGILFLLMLFFSPLAKSVPAFATAPALLFVACLMARGLTEVDWEDPTEYAPAVVTAIAMPLTYSIATGIGLGFITYALCKVISGRIAEAKPAVLVLAALFAVKFAVSG